MFEFHSTTPVTILLRVDYYQKLPFKYVRILIGIHSLMSDGISNSPASSRRAYIISRLQIDGSLGCNCSLGKYQ
jgi:hypothetical protein